MRLVWYSHYVDTYDGKWYIFCGGNRKYMTRSGLYQSKPEFFASRANAIQVLKKAINAKRPVRRVTP